MIASSYMAGSSVSEPAATDSELRLLLPANDVAQPELSIVIPALNEELTIGQFVDWCQEGLRRAKVRGEVLIIDSSTDATAEVALAQGARVLKTPKRGLGRAYIDAIPFIRGDYVLMGDADCTYDFRDLEPFMAKFHDGYEYVMGSRFRGYIEPGSMPPLHRYFGTPFNYLDAQSAVRESIFRYSLWHARDYPEACADGSAIAILGIRLGDGLEVGSSRAEDYRSAGYVL